MNTQNKLIAEFMGYSQPHPDYPQSTYWHKEGEAPLTILSFDTDWNWLMEVVEKIEGLNFSVEINKQEENDYQCLIIKNHILIQTFSTKKIQAVYIACVEFINYYNEQKQ